MRTATSTREKRPPRGLQAKKSGTRGKGKENKASTRHKKRHFGRDTLEESRSGHSTGRNNAPATHLPPVSRLLPAPLPRAAPPAQTHGAAGPARRSRKTFPRLHHGTTERLPAGDKPGCALQRPAPRSARDARPRRGGSRQNRGRSRSPPRGQPAAPQTFHPPPAHTGRRPQPSPLLPGEETRGGHRPRSPGPSPAPAAAAHAQRSRRRPIGAARAAAPASPPGSCCGAAPEPSGAERSLRRAERLRHSAAAAPPAAQARPRRPRSGGSPPAPRRDARPPPGLASAAARPRPRRGAGSPPINGWRGERRLEERTWFFPPPPKMNPPTKGPRSPGWV